ncbi:MAG: hypothetical protein JWO53_42 [Chlamydiia bacterium]|nr:hypothetical protein [Chlamydiia bacterium]
MEKCNALDLLLETNLRHLYKAEKAIFENLATLKSTAESPELKNILQHHREETQKQIHRLEEVFTILDINVSASKVQGLPSIRDQAKELLKTLADLNFTDQSKGLNGILSEGNELLRHFAKTEANDFALINAGQQVEHFEIACYQFLCFIIENKYQNEKILRLLTASLHEEIAMEKKLSEFAKETLCQSCCK